MNIGIVGYGIVGQTIYRSFSDVCDVCIVDPDKYETSMSDLIETSPKFIFVCVPSPEGPNGKCDTNIIERVFDQIHATHLSEPPIVILKSTIDPSSLVKLTEANRQFGVVYNPEFLRAHNAEYDHNHPSMQIFGGNKQDTIAVSEFYNIYSSITPCKDFFTDYTTAALAKYAINSYLATKVVFMNSLYDIHSASESGVSFDELTDIISTDPRIGTSHLLVPGLDGQRGYTGACLPKDTKAFSYYSSGLSPSIPSILPHIIILNGLFQLSD